MSSGNEILDVWDRNNATVERLAAVIEAAGLPAVRSIAKQGAIEGGKEAAERAEDAAKRIAEAAKQAHDAAKIAGRAIPRPIVALTVLGLLAGLGGAGVVGWWIGSRPPPLKPLDFEAKCADGVTVQTFTDGEQKGGSWCWVVVPPASAKKR